MVTQIYDSLIEMLKKHHNLYRFPVKAELWEDIFDQSINGKDSNWQGGGHSVGADIITETSTFFKKGSRLQNKSGDLNFKRNQLKWNGHRTTKYKTIEDKINFISSNHYDYYVMLSRNRTEWYNGIKAYYLYIFESSLIDYSKLNWVEKYNKKGKLSGWVGSHNDLPYTASIHRSMSDQLWTTVDLEYLPDGYRIEV